MPEELSQEDIDALLSGGALDDASADLGSLLGTPEPAGMRDFGDGGGGGGGGGEVNEASLEMLYDVELDVKIELGRCRMSVEDILQLREGSVIQLEKDAGAPVDILINNRLVAFGEVLVLNDYFCVRVTEILSDVDRAIAGR